MSDWLPELPELPELTPDEPDRPSPIGVPDDYVPNQNPNGPNYPIDALGPGGPNTFQNPLYMEGSEFSMLANMTPQQIAAIQAQLEGLGIISDFTPGVMDGSTVSGFGNLLALSNLNGQTWQQMMTTLGEAGGLNGGSGGPTRAPLVTRTSNPETLRRYLRRAVVEMTGSSQSPDIDIDQMVEAYQAIERSHQENLYNAQVTGGEVVEPPSVDEFVQGELEEDFGVEIQANSIAERAGSLLGKIAGGQV